LYTKIWAFKFPAFGVSSFLPTSFLSWILIEVTYLLMEDLKLTSIDCTSLIQGGPRICIALNMVMLQAVKVIVKVFKQFDLEFAPGW
jgi:hypothetical protein